MISKVDKYALIIIPLFFFLPRFFFFFLNCKMRKTRDFLPQGCVRYDVYRYIYIAREFSFHRDIGFFPPATLLSLHRFLLYYPSIPTSSLLYRSLSQTKQSRTRSGSPYVRLLGDNLYTRPPI